jgi:hypothetical protein
MSNIDGQIGTGNTIAPALSLGVHIITLIATDGQNNESSATITLTVKLGKAQPPKLSPNLVSPKESESLSETAPILKWTNLQDADAYRIEIARNIDFTNSFQSVDVFDSLYQANDLTEGKYYWRVRGLNAAGDGDWSSLGSFIIDVTPPDIPTPISPVDGSVITDLQPTFTWTKISDAQNYEIRLDTINPPFRTETIHNQVMYKPTSKLIPTTYFWQVRAIDVAGNSSAWSQIYALSVQFPPNYPPTINYYSTDKPTLTWSPITWAALYQIEVSEDKTFNATAKFTATVPASSLSITTDHLPDGTYYWRVRACTSSIACSAWSQSVEIVVDS